MTSAAEKVLTSSNVAMPVAIFLLLTVAPPMVKPDAVPVVDAVFPTTDALVPDGVTRNASLTAEPLASTKSVMTS